MTIFEQLLIAIGLSMDAFAISVVYGVVARKPKIWECVQPGVYFGMSQAIMPLLGYGAGTYFASKIQYLDHWIVFILLSFVGVKMIRESCSADTNTDKGFSFGVLLGLAVATSIDALAVGISFAFFEINIWTVALLIGLTTFLICVVGVKIGNVFGIRYKAKAVFIGGIILVLLGVKVLVEHLFFM